MKVHRICAVCYAALLIAFTGYVVLDTFVLTDTYQTDVTEMNLSLFQEESTESAESTEDTESSSAAASQGKNTHAQGRHGRLSGGSTEIGTENDESTNTASASSAAESYQDENVSVTLTTYYENDTKIYVADVQLRSAQYLKTAFANGTYGKNVTAKTSETAAENGAILASRLFQEFFRRTGVWLCDSQRRDLP